MPWGIHRIYDTKPDMAVYAKSISNGYAMSIIAGSSKVMESTVHKIHLFQVLIGPRE